MNDIGGIIDLEQFNCLDSVNDEDNYSQDKPGFLRHHDYSLDSPIILDDLIKAYDSRNASDSFRNNFCLRELRTLFGYIENPIHPNNIHSTMAVFILNTTQQIKNYNQKWGNALKWSNDYLIKMFQIPETVNLTLDGFFKTVCPGMSQHEQYWVNFKNNLKTLNDHPFNDLNIYWNLYQHFHLFVMVMNASNDQEIKNILKSYPRGFIMNYNLQKKINNQNYYSITSVGMGSLIIGKQGLLIKSLNVVLDKDLTLMYQDLFSARFCTLLLLLYPDPKYSLDLKQYCEELYAKGDSLVGKNGNLAFDAIKMLEAACNDRIRKLAETNPDVVSDTNFENFLKKEQQELVLKLGTECEQYFAHIAKLNNVFDAVFIHGLFRHWGHPYIEYFEGLKQLHENVTLEKIIDIDYVHKLASDLARRLIHHYFQQHKVWPIKIDSLPENHPFYKHVRDSTWPNRNELRKFGDQWNLLPFHKIFDVPSSLNLSEIIDDKSHSLNKSELIAALLNGSIGGSEQRKVILSTLNHEEINIQEFLQKIDEEGLDEDDLVIGLRAKERELKRIGRFFALMTLKLRIYFVVTELMISSKVLPLFPSLTMSTSMNDVFQKMTKCAPGHGTDFNTSVTYAEHFDYLKWNNHQRYDSTAPVFEIIDRAFGFTNVIKRTHQIFEQSFIYFANRPDLMKVSDGKIINKDPNKIVCWNGQAGGLEGLRQKGWSLISLLMIERESRMRNPRVQTLAQGDNQVVCISYALPAEDDPVAKQRNYLDVFKNRSYLLKCIYQGADKLGLKIKPDESWGSYNYLIYGKFAMVGGNLICSEGKRYARINIVSNDLIQSMSNSLSSVVTTCLTVCQQSDSVTKPIHMYVVFGLWIVRATLQYNLIISGSILKWKDILKLDIELTRILFLDSSLGGQGGSSLLRFFIRQFPDPITESLCFWKIVHMSNKNPQLQNLAISAGYPSIKDFELHDILRLIESPASLNCTILPNSGSILKQLIRKELLADINSIKHTTIKECLLHTHLECDKFLVFLNSIRPRFPRFLSNFYSSSIYGFTDSIIGLIQNSKTIRLLFSHKLTQTMTEIITSNEMITIKKLLTNQNSAGNEMWVCSSTHADWLRYKSWGEIQGVTIPHPAELLVLTKGTTCFLNHESRDYLTCHFDFTSDWWQAFKKGPCNPYMGSTTSSLTELYNAWEKKTDLILLKKALQLRVTLNWFVQPDSSIHQAMINNLQSLTETRVENLMTPGPLRAGSYIHRYKTPYLSASGFSAINHNKLRFTLSTTDTMSHLAKTNWDFMYQTVLLYSQTIATCLSSSHSESGVLHGHINCIQCLRPVTEVFLSTPLPPPKFHELSMTNSLYVREDQLPFIIDQIHLKELLPIRSVEFSCEISYQIGLTQGFLTTLAISHNLMIGDIGFVFSKTVFDLLNPPYYFDGFLIGVIRASLINSLSLQFVFTKKDRRINIRGQLLSNCVRITETPDIAALLSSTQFSNYLSNVSHITGAQYPLSTPETLGLLRTFLVARLTSRISSYIKKICNTTRVILFPETTTAFIATSLVLSIPLCRGLLLKNELTREAIFKIKTLIELTNQKNTKNIQSITNQLKTLQIQVYVCNEDMKTIAKNEPSSFNLIKRSLNIYSEYEGTSSYVQLESTTNQFGLRSHLIQCPNRYNPLMTGLRLVQIQTGAHYKIKCLFKYLKNYPSNVICIGDVAGTCTSLILRRFKDVRVAFHCPMDLSKFPGGGLHPAPPSSVTRLPESLKARCLNLSTAWEEPSDITKSPAWDNLFNKFPEHSIDMIIIESGDLLPSEYSLLIGQLLQRLTQCKLNISVIIKCFYSLLFDSNYCVLNQLLSTFEDVKAITTEYTGSFSSEFYAICTIPREISQPRYLSPVSCKNLSKIIRSLRTPEEELHRAINLSSFNTCQGLTQEFWVRGEVILLGLIMKLQVSPAVATKVHCILSRSSNFAEFVGAVFLSWAYISKEINIKINNKIGLVEGFPIPSAEWLEEFGVMMLGIAHYLIFILRRVSSYQEILDLNLLLLFYTIQGDNIRWSILNKFERSMRCRISKKRALMATWIRALECYRCERQHKIADFQLDLAAKYLIHNMIPIEYKYFNMNFLKSDTGYFEFSSKILHLDVTEFFHHHCTDCPTYAETPTDQFIFSDLMEQELADQIL